MNEIEMSFGKNTPPETEDIAVQCSPYDDDENDHFAVNPP